MSIQHENLAAGEWYKLLLVEQLGNIGSEVSRAIYWQNKDRRLFKNTMDRAFELLDLTIQDSRWRNRLKELVRVREIMADAISGGQEYNSTLEAINRYFFYFAFASRISR